MPDQDDVIDSLRRAVAAMPQEVGLRLHLAELLLDHDRREEAVAEVAAALQLEPDSAQARALMRRALAPDIPTDTATGTTTDDGIGVVAGTTQPPAEPPEPPVQPPADYDWSAGEEDLDGAVPPMFVTGEPPGPAEGAADHQDRAAEPPVTLADVAGMAKVKERLESAFLAPLRNPRLRTLFGKDLRGGLLLYGPPGCGKTYVARAVAGEMEAAFLSVSLADVLGMYIGQSERNLHQVFDVARRTQPCVVFLDEVDALGQKRSQVGGSARRGTVNQLLEELDGLGGSNEGVFVLAATNHPWDVDSALRRPGRFDRMLFVSPPDPAARSALLVKELSARPVVEIDVPELVAATDGYSGADLVHLCQAAAERALVDAARTGEVRMIGMDDLRAALTEVRPSIGSWLQTARNVALFGNQGGEYDDLVAYLQLAKVL